MLKNKIYRLSEIIKYLITPSPSMLYIGWLGHYNLGDEAIFEATSRVFKPINTAYRIPISRITINKILDLKPHVGTLLGGGTQIGEKSPLESFKYGQERFGNGIVFGTGVSPVLGAEPPTWLKNWGKVLSRCKYVGVRGVDSARTLSKVGINADVLGDTACLFTKPAGYWTPKEKTLGINIGQSYGHVFGDETEIKINVARIVRILKSRGWDVEFFCVWPHDLKTARETARYAGIECPVIHIHCENAEDYLKQIKNTTVFVGMKLHSVVLAACAGVPSIMLEYRPKCREFMNSIGMSRYTHRTDRLDVDLIIDQVESLEDNGKEISFVITNQMESHRLYIVERAKSLKKLLQEYKDD